MTKRRIKWPKLPTVIQGAGGPIRVRLVKRTVIDGEACWGSWESEKRTIRIDRAGEPQHRWRTLHHELTHAALDDAGIAYLLSDAGNESICEAMASARMAQMIADLSS